ncbi:hypothetical protein HKD37_08G022846 [Glycine soja]
MDNHEHTNHRDTAQARIKNKGIRKHKVNDQAQNIDFNIRDSSEDESSESTQVSSPENQNYMSSANDPAINREGYSDLGDQLMQCSHCNANMWMARDRLQDVQVNNIKLKLIANREKDGRTYNVPIVPEVAALIVGDFDANSKRDIIIETQHGQLQRIHELHSSYLALQYPLLFPYGEDGYRPDILHSSRSDVYRRRNNGNAIEKNGVIIDNRYICPCESTWRIFGFPIHGRKPDVERLHFHLPGQHSVLYEDHDDIDDVLSRPSIFDSKFISWMNTNQNSVEGRNLTYVEFVSKFVYNQKKRCWHLRKKGYTIGRLLWVPPITGELFYLRMMLTVCKGPTSFEDLRTVDNVQYSTYKEACFAMGFLQDDKEFIEAIKEAKDWGSAHYIRKLFVLLLLTATMSKPEQVWDQTWHWMADDIVYNYKKSSTSPALQLDDRTLQNLVLLEIEELLQANQRSLRDYPSMSYPEDANCPAYLDNSLILAELNYNNEELRSEFEHLFSHKTDEQASIYNEIVEAVNKDEGGMFFLYGYGGTGKTYIWKTLASSLRADNKIVIMVASSGIASLLLPGDLSHHDNDPEYFQTRAILAFTNEVVQQVNDYMLTMIPGEQMEYLSSDSVDKSETIESCHFRSLTIEFLNSLTTSGLPNHCLKLKIGTPIMLLRNLDQTQGLCNGTRQHKGKLYFADGLTRLRTELQIYESVTINFLACDHPSKFDLHFTPPLDQQKCKRRRATRKHIWTYEITQSMLGAPYPLQLSASVTQCLIHCGDHMTILRRFGPPLQWNVVVLDKGIGDKYVTLPWYKFLQEGDFSHEDELSFYYRRAEKI